jgi:hypothetical protein
MLHVLGKGLVATDLFFEWDLGFTGFAGGFGEEQLTRIISRRNKILLIIPVLFLNFKFAISVGMKQENLAYTVFNQDSYPSRFTK